VIMGSKDPDFPDPVAEAAWVADSLAGPTEKLIVEGVGHYPHAEAIDEVAPAIIDYLKQH